MQDLADRAYVLLDGVSGGRWGWMGVVVVGGGGW